MPRKARIDTIGALHHIIIRAVSKAATRVRGNDERKDVWEYLLEKM